MTSRKFIRITNNEEWKVWKFLWNTPDFNFAVLCLNIRRQRQQRFYFDAFMEKHGTWSNKIGFRSIAYYNTFTRRSPMLPVQLSVYVRQGVSQTITQIVEVSLKLKFSNENLHWKSACPS